MLLTPDQQDALVEIANVGTGKAAKQLSMLLNDTVQMNVPEVAVGLYHELAALLGLDANNVLVGVQQKARGTLDAQISLLFHSQESQQLARELVGTGLPVVDIDMRSLEHDAMTEIGNIVISSCISVISDLLGGNTQLSLPVYAEGNLDHVLRQSPKEPSEEECIVLLMKTHMRAVKREVQGVLVVTISQTNLETLTRRIDQWLASLQLN